MWGDGETFGRKRYSQGKIDLGRVPYWGTTGTKRIADTKLTLPQAYLGPSLLPACHFQRCPQLPHRAKVRDVFQGSLPRPPILAQIIYFENIRLLLQYSPP